MERKYLLELKRSLRPGAPMTATLSSFKQGEPVVIVASVDEDSAAVGVPDVFARLAEQLVDIESRNGELP